MYTALIFIGANLIILLASLFPSFIVRSINRIWGRFQFKIPKRWSKTTSAEGELRTLLIVDAVVCVNLFLGIESLLRFIQADHIVHYCLALGFCFVIYLFGRFRELIRLDMDTDPSGRWERRHAARAEERNTMMAEALVKAERTIRKLEKRVAKSSGRDVSEVDRILCNEEYLLAAYKEELTAYRTRWNKEPSETALGGLMDTALLKSRAYFSRWAEQELKSEREQNRS